MAHGDTGKRRHGRSIALLTLAAHNWSALEYRFASSGVDPAQLEASRFLDWVEGWYTDPELDSDFVKKFRSQMEEADEVDYFGMRKEQVEDLQRPSHRDESESAFITMLGGFGGGLILEDPSQLLAGQQPTPERPQPERPFLLPGLELIE